MPGEQARWMPRGMVREDPRNFLRRIIVKLPEHSGPAEHHDYLPLINRCLSDRHTFVHESNSLVALAESLHCGRTTCEELHARYFDNLVAVPWEAVNKKVGQAMAAGADSLSDTARKARQYVVVGGAELSAIE